MEAEGVSCTDTWSQGVWGRRRSRCKGLSAAGRPLWQELGKGCMGMWLRRVGCGLELRSVIERLTLTEARAKRSLWMERPGLELTG